LENQHSARTEHITAGKAKATVDTLKTAKKIFSEQCHVVRKSGQKQIRLLFIREGTEARRGAREVENFYYACFYDLLQMPKQHEDRPAKINQLKAKLVNLFKTTRA
jgi:hypothetical protein